mgnify:FL=1
MKKCPHNTDDKTIKTNAQSGGQSLFAAYRENDILRKEIYPSDNETRSDIIYSENRSSNT